MLFSFTPIPFQRSSFHVPIISLLYMFRSSFSLLDWHHRTSLLIFRHSFSIKYTPTKFHPSHQFQLSHLHLSFQCSPLKVQMLSLILFSSLHLLFPLKKPLSLNLPLYRSQSFGLMHSPYSSFLPNVLSTLSFDASR